MLAVFNDLQFSPLTETNTLNIKFVCEINQFICFEMATILNNDLFPDFYALMTLRLIKCLFCQAEQRLYFRKQFKV